MTLTLIALNFSDANQCENLISAANAAGCLPSKVYKARDTPQPLAQLHRTTSFPSYVKDSCKRESPPVRRQP